MIGAPVPRFGFRSVSSGTIVPALDLTKMKRVASTSERYGMSACIMTL